MGYYLGVSVVYGVAWDDAPGSVYEGGDEGEGRHPIEIGRPVYGDRLCWGQHGHFGEPCWHLEVCEALSGEQQSRYGYRVRWEEPDVDEILRWDAWIIDYLTGLGLTPEQIPAPGWLALGEFG